MHHIGQALRVSALIELVGTETRKLVDRAYPNEGSKRNAEAGLVKARTSGVVIKID